MKAFELLLYVIVRQKMSFHTLTIRLFTVKIDGSFHGVIEVKLIK